jgi:hypothetical protein
MSAGRPTDYTLELAARICARLSEGESLRSVCKSDDMPATSTIFLWIQRHKEFSEQYARAKEESADALAEEILDIADDGSNDWMKRFSKDDPEGAASWMLNGEHVQRSRLRVDTRKWIASKLKPKKYGDKIGVGGAEGLPPVAYTEIAVRAFDAAIDRPPEEG